MIIKRNEETGVVYLAYQSFEETGLVKHGFSTRCGGVSEGYLGSMNLSYSRGDKKENVDENFKRIATAIGFNKENLVLTDQTHTTNLRVVTEADRGKGFIKERDYKDIDGLVTNVKGLVLSAFFADCVPLYFLDPVKGAIGLSHSGWRGTVGKIGAKTIQLMQEEYGSRPQDILVGIGPSICRDCYEVSEDVAEEFRNNFTSEQCKEFLISGKKEGKYQLDLWKANEIILKESHICEENISLPGICTCCNKEFLYSHRGSNGKRGNLGAFLMLC